MKLNLKIRWIKSATEQKVSFLEKIKNVNFV